MNVPVRSATAADAPALAGALARAFHDDPVMVWAVPDDTRRSRRLPPLFEAEIVHLHLPRGEVYTTEDIGGGALWSPPGRWRMPGPAVLRTFPRLLAAVGRRLPIYLRGIATVEQAHPAEPHWYLAGLGTDPPAQRRGVGSALLRPVLDRCDREGHPAYLECSREGTVAFYHHHGFDVTRTITLTDDGPTLWLMWRRPAR